MNKKTFALFLLVLIVGMGYSLSNIMERETSLSSEAPRSTIGADAFRPMPKSSSQDYYFKEKAILTKTWPSSRRKLSRQRRPSQS